MYHVRERQEVLKIFLYGNLLKNNNLEEQEGVEVIGLKLEVGW
jgi:hypothetical protein